MRSQPEWWKEIDEKHENLYFLLVATFAYTVKIGFSMDDESSEIKETHE